MVLNTSKPSQINHATWYKNIAKTTAVIVSNCKRVHPGAVLNFLLWWRWMYI
jgi:hypothetical protein